MTTTTVLGPLDTAVRVPGGEKFVQPGHPMFSSVVMAPHEFWNGTDWVPSNPDTAGSLIEAVRTGEAKPAFDDDEDELELEEKPKKSKYKSSRKAEKRDDDEDDIDDDAGFFKNTAKQQKPLEAKRPLQKPAKPLTPMQEKRNAVKDYLRRNRKERLNADYDFLIKIDVDHDDIFTNSSYGSGSDPTIFLERNPLFTPCPPVGAYTIPVLVSPSVVDAPRVKDGVQYFDLRPRLAQEDLLKFIDWLYDHVDAERWMSRVSFDIVLDHEYVNDVPALFGWRVHNIGKYVRPTNAAGSTSFNRLIKMRSMLQFPHGFAYDSDSETLVITYAQDDFMPANNVGWHYLQLNQLTYRPEGQSTLLSTTSSPRHSDDDDDDDDDDYPSRSTLPRKPKTIASVITDSLSIVHIVNLLPHGTDNTQSRVYQAVSTDSGWADIHMHYEPKSVNELLSQNGIDEVEFERLWREKTTAPLQQRITELEAEHTSLQSSLLGVTARLAEQRRQVRLLNSAKVFEPEELRRTLTKLHNIESVHCNQSALVLKTGDIWMDDRSYYIGQFKIKIHLGLTKIVILNTMMHQADGVMHPHVQRDSNFTPCWGGYYDLLTSAVQYQDLNQLIAVLMEYLTSTNPKDVIAKGNLKSSFRDHKPTGEGFVSAPTVISLNDY